MQQKKKVIDAGKKAGRPHEYRLDALDNVPPLTAKVLTKGGGKPSTAQARKRHKARGRPKAHVMEGRKSGRPRKYHL